MRGPTLTEGGGVTASADLINRARKLLALSSSPNEHEAAAAANRLQELLVRNQLAASDLEDASLNVGIGEEVADQNKKVVRWRSNLLTYVAQTHLCEYIISRRWSEDSWKIRHVLIGTPDNTAMAKTVFEYLASAVERVSKQALEKAVEQRDWEAVDSPRAWANSFRVGCVMRLGARLKDRFNKMKAEGLGAEAQDGAPDAAACSALAICNAIKANTEAIAEYKSVAFPDLRSQRQTSSVSQFGAFLSGQKAGGTISLSQQIRPGGRVSALGSGS